MPLEERLERLEGRRTAVDVAQEILKISRRCKALPEADQRDADEILGYDEGNFRDFGSGVVNGGNCRVG
jgi:hypothetical protein